MKLRHASSALPLCLCLTAGAQEATLPTVTITAEANDVAERQGAATQKVIINRQDIENMGALTVSDVMGKLPGVDAGSPGADGSMALKARGMSRDSVQIFIDGEKVAGHARMAQAMVGRLPSTELERVEILRGASAEFGGNAPVTVNLVFKKARPKDATTLKAAVGFRNDEPNAQFSVSQGGGDQGFSWMLPLTLNYHNMPSVQDLSRQDSTGSWQEEHQESRYVMKETVFSPRFTWKADRDSLTLRPSLFRAFGRRQADTERSNLVIPDNDSNRHDDEHNRSAFNRLRGEGEMIRGGTKYSMRFAGSDGDRRSYVTRNRTTVTGSNGITDEQSRRQERDINGALRLDWSAGSHALAAALEASGHRRKDSQFHTDAGDETHRGWDRQWALWLQDEWGVSSGVTVTSGLRGEFIRYAMDDNGRRYDRLLPSIALRWEPAPQWVWRSSLGAGIKPPKLSELSSQPVYSVGTNAPTEPDQRGNPDLRAERSLNFEAVLEHYLPGEMGVFGINAYLRRTQDFIERRLSLESGRWVERPWNEGDARHWGVELDGKLRTDKLGWPGATWRAHLTLPRSRVDDQRLGVSRAARESPRFVASAGYDQTLPAGVSFGASVQHSGAVRTQVPDSQDYLTRRRTVLDAYVLKRLTAQLNLRLSLQNLLKADTRRQLYVEDGADQWSLASTSGGVRTVLLSLEGKW